MSTPRYFGVLSNRDHIKYQGEKMPFWMFLDRQPDGWLCSLAYAKGNELAAGIMRTSPMIWDCGAWSYKAEEVPKLGKNLVTPEWAMEQYRQYAKRGDMVIAPDHMLIPGLGDLNARRRFNRDSAERFITLVGDSGLLPMATIHGETIDERVEQAEWLWSLGYRHLALGGLAGQASRKAMILSVVAAVREVVPDAWLHALGLSSPAFAAEWQRLGIQSFDGASHFKQAFTAGTFFTEADGELTKHQAGRKGEGVEIPECDCRACRQLREDGIDTRTYGSNENNMGRAAHNLNMLMRAHDDVLCSTIVLVACVGEKLDHPAPAKDLYQSDWFKKARAYAERYGDSWYILSAKYGIVQPDEVIEPYNVTLNTMSRIDRKRWSYSVSGRLTGLMAGERRKFIILAGQHYREILEGELVRSGHVVSVPMRGLGIGQQLAWMKERAERTDVVQLGMLLQ